MFKAQQRIKNILNKTVKMEKEEERSSKLINIAYI